MHLPAVVSVGLPCLQAIAEQVPDPSLLGQPPSTQQNFALGEPRQAPEEHWSLSVHGWPAFSRHWWLPRSHVYSAWQSDDPLHWVRHTAFALESSHVNALQGSGSEFTHPPWPSQRGCITLLLSALQVGFWSQGLLLGKSQLVPEHPVAAQRVP
jgi:hypothetical protein